jgi:hypothetical protein
LTSNPSITKTRTTKVVFGEGFGLKGNNNRFNVASGQMSLKVTGAQFYYCRDEVESGILTGGITSLSAGCPELGTITKLSIGPGRTLDKTDFTIQ